VIDPPGSTHSAYPLAVVANLMLWTAYIAVPVLLLLLARKQTAPRRRVFGLLAGLFTIGGLAHAISDVHGQVGAGVSILAAMVVSVAAVVVAVRLFPRALDADEQDVRAGELERLRVLQAALAASPDGVVVAAPTGEGGLAVVYANPAFEGLTGYSIEEVLGHSPSTFCQVSLGDGPPAEIDPEEAEAAELVRDALRAEHTVRVEVLGRRKDKTRMWVEWHVVSVPDPAGRPALRVAILRDTTARRKAEESARGLTAELRRQITQREALVELCPVGIAVAEDPQGRSVHVNQVLRELLDLPPAADPELTPAPVRLQVRFRRDGRAVPHADQPLQRCLRTGEPVDGEEYVVGRGSEDDRVVVVSARPMRDDAGRVRGAVAVFTDLTDRKRLEEQYRQAQKMEAVGRLAGGVAHDFNNLLTVIQGNADLLRAAVGGADTELLDQLRLAADRAAGLVRQLLTFSRRQPTRTEVIDLGDVVGEMAGMLRRVLGERVTVQTEIGPESVRVSVDRSQIEQVILNLAVNSRDAMPDGGTLTLRVGTGDDDGRRLARLWVADTGCGIPSELRSRVFEPFFTTKGPDRGTGLGLAIVFGVVQQAGGKIDIDSAPGCGTTFRIDLPWSDAPAAAPPGSVAAPPASAGRGRKVLLVEDEDGVRKLARFALEAHGYAVTEAPDGESALGLLDTADGPDLLVTDMTMPGIDGRDLAGRVRARRPGVGVVFTSGYVPDDSRLGGLPGSVFLPKPFTPADLLRAAGAAVAATAP
jgi:PAS domain S-box-containing protein